MSDPYEFITSDLKKLRLSNPVTDATYSLADMVADMKEVEDRIICGEAFQSEREWFDWAKPKLEAWAENAPSGQEE